MAVVPRKTPPAPTSHEPPLMCCDLGFYLKFNSRAMVFLLFLFHLAAIEPLSSSGAITTALVANSTAFGRRTGHGVAVSPILPLHPLSTSYDPLPLPPTFHEVSKVY